MSKLEYKRIGRYIELLTDYHSNGSYETLKNNVELLPQKNYAIMIRTLNFERNDFSEDLIYVDKHAYEYLSKSKVFPNDILTNKIANPGSIYIMPDLHTFVTCGMNLFLIRFSKEVNQRYMYYCMKNSEKSIKELAHGTTTKTITKDDVRSISLFMHTDINEQNKIEQLLTSIDKKIDRNNKINDNLEAMTYDIYMYTFFSKKPTGKLKDILVEAGKSLVQVGEAKSSNGEYPFFTSGATILKWDVPFTDGRNCFLNTGGNADVKFYVGNAAYSTDTWCVSANGNMSDYLYLLLFSIKTELDKKFFQGTGLRHLQKPLLKERPIYIPEKSELETFNKQVMPMLNIISENTRENQQLTTLRDWLLPMLMNGQATISD